MVNPKENALLKTMGGKGQRVQERDSVKNAPGDRDPVKLVASSQLARKLLDGWRSSDAETRQEQFESLCEFSC